MIIKDRLIQLHKQEDLMNKELSSIDNEIKALIKRKEKLKKRISGNMKFRNRLIEKL